MRHMWGVCKSFLHALWFSHICFFSLFHVFFLVLFSLFHVFFPFTINFSPFLLFLFVHFFLFFYILSFPFLFAINIFISISLLLLLFFRPKEPIFDCDFTYFIWTFISLFYLAFSNWTFISLFYLDFFFFHFFLFYRCHILDFFQIFI